MLIRVRDPVDSSQCAATKIEWDIARAEDANLADIFISYAREDFSRVRLIAEALEAKGWSTWWDPQILPHESFRSVIERELADSSVVLVAWSASSRSSEWVQAEASVGLEQEKLVQVRFDDSSVPIPFGQRQVADLSGWSGEPEDEKWLNVLHSVRHLAGEPKAEKPMVPTNTGSAVDDSRRYAWFAVLGSIVVVLFAYFQSNGMSPGGELAPTPVDPNSTVIETPGAGVDGSDFVKRLVTLADREWKFFGSPEIDIDGQTVRAGATEIELDYPQRVGDYWQSLDMDADGNDRDLPWSAGFISYLMKTAGADDNFKYSAAHSKYIHDAIRNSGDVSAAFRGRRVEEYAPDHGDLICSWRSRPITFDEAIESTLYSSHCGIVVAKRDTEIEVISGNVGNSVVKRHLPLTSSGLLNDPDGRYFAIIQTNL